MFPVEDEDHTAAPLEELVEEIDSGPGALESGTKVTSASGTVYTVLSVQMNDGPTRQYEAVVEHSDKHVLLREATSSAAIARLNQEALILQGLDCPMFLQPLDSFESNGHAYLVTESANTSTIFLQNSSTAGDSLSATLSVLAQVSYGLSKLHSQGWVHLGIRPTAIVTGKPIKISNLGYAVRIGEKAPAAFYHAGYSAPDLLGGESVDPSADVYSVGALLFHAVTGAPIPETGVELSTWKPAHPVAGVPQILHRCLGDRESRFASMDDLHRELLRLARRGPSSINYAFGAATTIGLEPTRITNQDALITVAGKSEREQGQVAWAVTCVADGMGGMSAGDIASEVAAASVQQDASSDMVANPVLTAEEQVEMTRRWVASANDKVVAAMEERKVRGGCTLVCACLWNRRLTIGHVGDCRIYLVRGRQATVLTRDHSLAMAHVMQGEASLEDIRQHPDRSKVTRSIGERRPLPDYYTDSLQQMMGAAHLELENGDVVLLCSDGLWEPVLDEEMVNMIQYHAPDLNATALTLLEITLDRGGADNATVVLVRLDTTEEPQESRP